MVAFEVEFYERESGRKPTEDALKEIRKTSEDLFKATLAGITELGSSISFSSTLTEKVDDKLWCLRVRFRNTWARIFFTIKGSIIWLLNGYVKKSNKIPLRKLRTAINLMKEVQYAR